MTDEQVRDEALTLFLAGHETMANALTWTWYLLAQHPEVERRLHEEIDASVASAAPSPDDFERLPYTRAVLAEALRLYPPVWLVVRRPIERYAIAGHVVPPGDLVFLSQYVVHHDPRFFPDPFRFDPERWRPEDAAGRPKFSYFPFGGGPRLCIGEGFAWMEGMLVLATLAGVWRLRSVPGRRVELEAAITLRPKHGLPMTLERRM
jgi:cytochrome P450